LWNAAVESIDFKFNELINSQWEEDLMFGFSFGLTFVYFIWMPFLILLSIIYGCWAYEKQKHTEG